MRNLFLFIMVLVSEVLFPQADTALKRKKEPYFRKEEIIYDSKRYRRYNNYVTMGGGFILSSMRSDISKTVAFDYHFHIKREYFQIGLNMSGPEFLSNNNVQAHLGYGLRRERHNSNFAAFAGLTYDYGVIAIEDSTGAFIPRYYDGPGIYITAQAITKLAYDIGFGGIFFAEYTKEQSMLGVKFVLYFSGAYRGPKKNYNPNVRSESRR